jgi:predicted 2-oxoglutarate/Fe(II)-dependent dioxygenase YbiX
MPTCVPDDLTTADVGEFRGVMDACEWEDGRSTAGAQSSTVNGNAPPDISSAPSNDLHTVSPVTRGVRVASFFWLQSMIRDAHARGLFWTSIRSFRSPVKRIGRDDPETVKLTGISQPHPLWAEV